MSVRPLKAVADLARALERASVTLPQSTYQLDFDVWTQTWSDTSCGFGGLAGQGFTQSTVIVCWRDPDGPLVVSIDGQGAYAVLPDDPRRASFIEQKATHRIPGAYDWKDSCKHRLPGNSNCCDFCGKAFYKEEWDELRAKAAEPVKAEAPKKQKTKKRLPLS
jgi:hypothetical protein